MRWPVVRSQRPARPSRDVVRARFPSTVSVADMTWFWWPSSSSTLAPVATSTRTALFPVSAHRTRFESRVKLTWNVSPPARL